MFLLLIKKLQKFPRILCHLSFGLYSRNKGQHLHQSDNGSKSRFCAMSLNPRNSPGCNHYYDSLIQMMKQGSGFCNFPKVT